MKKSPPNRPRAPAPAAVGKRQNAPPGKVRLIGGHWRGTRLPVPDLPGLRPTSERVRETLFNWLGSAVPGARVLDLFAGSGALGLEAVSRGAASAVLVERDPSLAASLRGIAARLQGGAAVQVVQAEAVGWLAVQAEEAFDIAFVDPPFGAGLWDALLPLLSRTLAPAGWLYLEAPLNAAPAAPADWYLHREGSTRETRYALYRRAQPTQPVAADTLAPDPADDLPPTST